MNYNFIAPYYHSLSKLIFFNQQHKAHLPILDFLQDGNKILWVGGGAGKFIKELDDLNIHLEIDYVDFSSKMIDLAKKNKYKHLSINFITADIFDYETNKEYDVIMTTFLFDHFSQDRSNQLFYKLYDDLKLEGIWFYVDFNPNQSKWQKVVTKLMLHFFRIIIGLEINQLPKMDSLFLSKLTSLKQEYFFHKYIESIIFRKETEE